MCGGGAFSPASVHRAAIAAVTLLAVLAGCRQDMHDTPRVDAYEATDAFADGRGNRHAGRGHGRARVI